MKRFFVFVLTVMLSLSGNLIADEIIKDLIFLEDFEQDDLAYFGEGEIIEVPFQSSHYRDGKFGRGYFFEKPRHNFFAKEVANPEEDSSVFKKIGNAELSLTETDSGYGENALEVSMPEKGSGVKVMQDEVFLKRHGEHEKEAFLLASCYIKGPKGEKIALDLKFKPVTQEDKKAILKKRRYKKPRTWVKDKSFSQTITLTGDWQRVAAYASGDPWIKQRTAEFSLVSEASTPLKVQIDGLQLEQAKYYPFHHLMPTTWTEGETELPNTTSTIKNRRFNRLFPVKAGTITFWTMTPLYSNFKKPGSINWLNFGIWWHNPVWGMGNYRFHAGPKEFCYFHRTNVADGNWHHVAMTWEVKQGKAFLDGKEVAKFDKSDVDISEKLEQYKFRLGGSVQSIGTANSVMDEIAVFKRALSKEEIAQIANTKTPLSDKFKEKLLLAAPKRTIFFRDEGNASLDFGLLLRKKYRPSEKGLFDKLSGIFSKSFTHTIEFSMPDLLKLEVKKSLEAGRNKITFEFDPYIFKSGDYKGKIKITAENGTVKEFPLSIKIVPPMRKDLFRLSTWGRGLSTPAWIEFCKTLGFNTVDCTSKDMALLGENGFLYNWHCRLGSGGSWGKGVSEKIEKKTIKNAKKCQPFPNWVSTLINSETGAGRIPAKKSLKKWYEEWAEKQLGFKIPEKGWQLGTSHNPKKVWFSESEKPGENGVFKPNKPLIFIEWFYNYGGPWWQVDTAVAKGVKKTRDDVITWTDPLHYPGQISKLDAGSNWAYDRCQGTVRIVEILRKSYTLARLVKKSFFPTLGMNYVGPGWLNVTMDDGKKRLLSPTVDDMTRHAWVAVAGIPADQLSYWAMVGLFDGIRKGKYYCAPDSAEKFGKIMKAEILPMAEMLKGAELSRNKIAVLLSQSTSIVNAGEGKWHWGVAHFPSFWQKWLIKNDLPYDVIVDQNATPENLKKYQVIIFPMALYVSEEIYQGLMDAAENGTKIIVDRYGRQDYPGQVKWDIGYHYMIPGKDREPNKVRALKYVADLKVSMAKDFFAFTKGEEGPLFTFVREFNGTKYVTVINDNRQPGEYTKLTKHPEFQPYGKPQKAKLWLDIPENYVVYDFLASKPLSGIKDNGKIMFDLQLSAAGGKLLVIYPEKISILNLDLDTEFERPSKGQIRATLRNSSGDLVKGLQLLNVSVTKPDGTLHDESGIYQMKNGETTVPLRFAKNDPAGKWHIEIKEKTSGIIVKKSFAVK